MKRKPQILEQTAADNEYLHKDFHGALCYAIKYLDDHFGPESTTEYLRQVGNTFFAPLSALLKKEGLPVLEKHFQKIFGQENGQFSIEYDEDILVLTVTRCPAIFHLKQRNLLFTERFCESTVIVNDTICKKAGIRCSCEYEPGQGRCIQKFRKEK